MKLKFCFSLAFGNPDHVDNNVNKRLNITAKDGRKLSLEWIYYIEVTEKKLLGIKFQPWTYPQYEQLDRQCHSCKKFSKMIDR